MQQHGSFVMHRLVILFSLTPTSFASASGCTALAPVFCNLDFEGLFSAEDWTLEDFSVPVTSAVVKPQQGTCKNIFNHHCHCSHVGPHLGTRVPMGTFFSFWVPIGSTFFFKVPIFCILDLRAHEKSVQPLSNVDHLILYDNKN